METSKRDTVISVLACLVVVAVLVPTLTITRTSSPDTRDQEDTGHDAAASVVDAASTVDAEAGVARVRQGLGLDDGKPASLARAEALLAKYPLIDGHNDFPYSVRELLHNDLSQVSCDWSVRGHVTRCSPLIGRSSTWTVTSPTWSPGPRPPPATQIYKGISKPCNSTKPRVSAQAAARRRGRAVLVSLHRVRGGEAGRRAQDVPRAGGGQHQQTVTCRHRAVDRENLCKLLTQF